MAIRLFSKFFTKSISLTFRLMSKFFNSLKNSTTAAPSRICALIHPSSSVLFLQALANMVGSAPEITEILAFPRIFLIAIGAV